MSATTCRDGLLTSKNNDTELKKKTIRETGFSRLLPVKCGVFSKTPVPCGATAYLLGSRSARFSPHTHAHVVAFNYNDIVRSRGDVRRTRVRVWKSYFLIEYYSSLPPPPVHLRG